MTVQTVLVETAHHRYPIYLCAGNSADAWAQLLAAWHFYPERSEGSPILRKHIVIITQQTILNAQPTLLTHLFKDAIPPVILLPDGEAHKNIQTWQHLMDQLINLKCHRNTLLVALGGGIVGDIVGFAASSFYRGLSYVQIPTTLIAQVDSSVGGKTGINHRHVKNAIGAFYHPQAVLINTHLLKTLPAREFTAGLAEVIKYALIADADFFIWLETNLSLILARDEQTLLHMITRCVTLKADIVGQDEQEKNGLRSLLNFGHTFGHALEACTDYQQFLHGEAVAIGMVLAAMLSKEHAGLSKESIQRIETLLRQSGLLNDHVKLPSAASLMDLMAADKKMLNNQWRFVLLKEIGSAMLVTDVSKSTVIDVLNKFSYQCALL